MCEGNDLTKNRKPPPFGSVPPTRTNSDDFPASPKRVCQRYSVVLTWQEKRGNASPISMLSHSGCLSTY